MNRSILALAAGAVVLTACATGPATETASRDEAYVPIGSNIPRRDGKRPEPAPVGALGPYTAGPGAAPRN